LQTGGRCLNVAWVGDCKAVLCRAREAVPLTRDHVPSEPIEAARVLAEGGQVEGGRLSGWLSVSRALGNYKSGCSKPAGLSAEPELRSEELRVDDEFVILASDGLWGVLSDEDAVRIARAELRAYDDAEMAAEKLVETALARKTEDNVTVLVLRLFAPTEKAERPLVRCPNGASPSRTHVRLATTTSFVQVVGGFGEDGPSSTLVRSEKSSSSVLTRTLPF